MATPPVLVPDFAVTINGVDLDTKEETKVFEVVFNDRVDAVDFFSIRLGLVEGAVARPDWIDDQLFREGGKAQIKLGYAGDALKTMIDGEALKAETALLVCGLESDEARQLAAALPTAEELMPALGLEDLGVKGWQPPQDAASRLLTPSAPADRKRRRMSPVSTKTPLTT